MAIKLTKNLKHIIVGQFKGGDSMKYLASIYGHTPARIEQVVRERMLALDEIIGTDRTHRRDAEFTDKQLEGGFPNPPLEEITK